MSKQRTYLLQFLVIFLIASYIYVIFLKIKPIKIMLKLIQDYIEMLIYFKCRGIPYFSSSVYNDTNIFAGGIMELICRIDEMRFKRGKMTQAELSERSGVAVNLISAYENHKRTPNAETLWKIARALDCKVDNLYKYK